MHFEVRDKKNLELVTTKAQLAAMTAVVALVALVFPLAGSMMALGIFATAALTALVTLSAFRYS